MRNILKKINKLLSNLIILVLSILLLIIIYGSIQLNILNKEYIDLFGYSFFEVKTGSMEPTIKKNDIVIVKLKQKIKENDVITYKKNEYFVTHRVIKKEENKIITKGDKNNKNDQPIENKDVIGKVVYTIKNVEVWKQVFKDRKVIISISLTIILLVIIISFKEKNGEKNDR